MTCGNTTRSQPESVLLVDGDDGQCESLAQALKESQYVVARISSVKEFRGLPNKYEFNVAIIESHLSDGSGHEITRILRSASDARVIILAERNTLADRIECYAQGADMHFGKPCPNVELIAAVTALISRQINQSCPQRSIDDHSTRAYWSLDLSSCAVVAPNGKKTTLAPKEFEIAKLLISRPNQLIGRHELMKSYGLEPSARSNAPAMCISRIRRHIYQSSGMNWPVQTRRNQGLIFIPGQILDNFSSHSHGRNGDRSFAFPTLGRGRITNRYPLM